MKRLIISLVTLLLFTTEKAAAQYYFYDNNYYDTKFQFEFGVSGGVMNCLTDVGGKIGIGGPFLKDLNIGNTKIQGGFYMSAMYNYAIGLRIEYTHGSVGAFDSIQKPYSDQTNGRYERNLSFRSTIDEVAAVFEIHPLFIFNDYAASDDAPPRLSPYLAFGIGHYQFNPQAQLNGRWVDLRPLHTEGEGFKEYPDRKEYKLDQYNMPIGIGVRFEAAEDLNIRIELLDRILFTDYLDDVSTRYIDPSYFSEYLQGQQLSDALALNLRNKNLPGSPPGTNSGPGSIRGNPKNNDNYFTLSIKVGYILGRDKIN